MLLQSCIWPTWSTRRLVSKIAGKRKPCSVTQSIPPGGAGMRSNLICPLHLWGEGCGEVSSFYREQATGTGHLRSNQFSFSLWYLSFTSLRPHCILGDNLLRHECTFRNLPPTFHGASGWWASPALLTLVEGAGWSYAWPGGGGRASGRFCWPSVLWGEWGGQYCPPGRCEMSPPWAALQAFVWGERH